jgi:hypothetical protein
MGAGLHIGLVVTALGLGFRHGIDWDHIAALTDLTGAQERPRRSMLLATLYALGHAAVVFVLGFAAIVLAARLPASIDSAMERLVGATLLLLGAYVLIALARHGRDFRMRSRWMLLADGIRRAAARWHRPAPIIIIEHEHEHHPHELHVHDDTNVHTRTRVAVPAHTHTGNDAQPNHHHHHHRHRHIATMPADPLPTIGPWTALLIGMLHGVGAETPTQVLIFATAAGVAGKGGGMLLLAFFLIGLLAANTAVALVGTFGALRANRNFHAYATISLVTATFSIITGAILLLGFANTLPAILGG